MEASQEFIDQLVASPSESLNVEVKRWLHPESEQGLVKIAIACMALRNRNGGYLIIGFDDETLQPDNNNRPDIIEESFHTDAIQSIVSRFASIPFEVTVRFGVRPEGRFPVVIVPEGTVVPVAAKRPYGEGRNILIRQDGVYFRTLNANGVPSSALATANDWRDIVEICFENREADIGRFLRRHLVPEGSSGGSQLLKIVSDERPAEPSLRDRTFALLSQNDERRKTIFSTDEFRDSALPFAAFGSWSAMMVIDPPLVASDTSQTFLNTIAGANPQYSGWPVWLDARNFRESAYRPRKQDKGWDTIILGGGEVSSANADFYRVHGRGELYMWRVLQDDLSDKVTPLKVFDPALMVLRIAEVIAVGLSVAKALDRGQDSTLGFAFRWQNIAGRTLQAWTNWRLYFSHYGESHDNSAEGFVAVPADTPVDAIAPYVKACTQELFGIWGGFEYPLAGIEQLVQKLISRSW